MQEIDLLALFKRIKSEDSSRFPRIPTYDSMEEWRHIKDVLCIYNNRLITFDNIKFNLILMDICTREQQEITIGKRVISSATWRSILFLGCAGGIVSVNLDSCEILDIWEGDSDDTGLRVSGVAIINYETVRKMNVTGDLLYFTSSFCPGSSNDDKAQTRVYCFDCVKWEHKWNSILPFRIKELDIQCAFEYDSLFYVGDTKVIYKLIPEQWEKLGEKARRYRHDKQYAIPIKHGILAGRVETDTKHFDPSQHTAVLYDGTLERQLLKLQEGATLAAGAATLGDYIVMAYSGRNIGLFDCETGRLTYSFHTEFPVIALDFQEGKICALTLNKRILVLTPENMEVQPSLAAAPEEHDDGLALEGRENELLEQAEELLKQADDYIEAGEDGDKITTLLNNAAELCRSIDKNEQVHKAQFTILSTMTSMGWYYETKKEHDKAFESYRGALEFCCRMCEKLRDTRFKARLLWLYYTIAYSFKKLNKLEEEEPYITEGLLYAQTFLGMLKRRDDGSYIAGEQLVIDEADEKLLKQYSYILFEAGELKKNLREFKEAHSFYFRSAAISLHLFYRNNDFELLKDWYSCGGERASLHIKAKEYSDALFIYTKITGELEKHIASSPPRYIEIDCFFYYRHRIRMELKVKKEQEAKDGFNKLVALVREDAARHHDIHGAKCRIQTCKLYFELFDEKEDFQTALEIRKWCASSYEEAFKLQPNEKLLTDAYKEYERIVNMCNGRDEKTAETYQGKMLLSPIRLKMLDNLAQDEIQRQKNKEGQALYLDKLQKEWAAKPTLVGYKMLMKLLDEVKSKENRDIYEDRLLTEFYNDLGAKMHAYVKSPCDAIREELFNVLEDWEGFYFYAANVRKIARFEDKSDYVARYKHTFRLYTVIEHERYIAYSWKEKEKILAMLLKAFRGVSGRSTEIGEYYQCGNLINQGRYNYNLDQYEANLCMANAIRAWQSCVMVGHTTLNSEVNEKQARETEILLARKIYSDEPTNENRGRLIVSLIADYLYGGDYSFENVMQGMAHQPPNEELMAFVKSYINGEPDFPLSKLARPWLKKEKVYKLEKGMAMVLKYYYEDNANTPMAPYIHLLAKLNDDFMNYGPTQTAKILRDILNKKEFDMSGRDLKILQEYRKKWYS